MKDNTCVLISVVALVLSGLSMVCSIYTDVSGYATDRTVREEHEAEEEFDEVSEYISEVVNVADESVDSVVNKDKHTIDSILIKSPDGNEYEFCSDDSVVGTLLPSEFRVGELVSNDGLYYMNGISHYISYGVAQEDILYSDGDTENYFILGSVNLGDADESPSDCHAYKFGIYNKEGWSINSIHIGQSIQDVIQTNGKPTSSSISDFGTISAVTYDYGAYIINAVGTPMSGKIYYVEVIHNYEI